MKYFLTLFIISFFVLTNEYSLAQRDSTFLQKQEDEKTFRIPLIPGKLTRTHVSAEKYEFENTKSLKFPFDAIWFELIQILKDHNFNVRHSDKLSGIITLLEIETTDTTMEARLCDCGRQTRKIRTYRGFERRPDQQITGYRTAHVTFYLTPVDSSDTEIKIVANFHLSKKGAQNVLDNPLLKGDHLLGYLYHKSYPDYIQCNSTGKLETWFLDQLESKVESHGANVKP